MNFESLQFLGLNPNSKCETLDMLPDLSVHQFPLGKIRKNSSYYIEVCCWLLDWLKALAFEFLGSSELPASAF